jgi:deoxyadenosine/deoxycytidine kinase
MPLAILDRSIYEDAHIFAVRFAPHGQPGGAMTIAYRRLFDIVVDALRVSSPDLFEGSVNVLMDRIRRRARNMETGISADYLSLLDSFYDEWLAAFDMCPVLTIRTDDLDFVHKPIHLETVVQRIQDKLAGKETVDLRG